MFPHCSYLQCTAVWGGGRFKVKFGCWTSSSAVGGGESFRCTFQHCCYHLTIVFVGMDWTAWPGLVWWKAALDGLDALSNASHSKIISMCHRHGCQFVCVQYLPWLRFGLVCLLKHNLMPKVLAMASVRPNTQMELFTCPWHRPQAYVCVCV